MGFLYTMLRKYRGARQGKKQDQWRTGKPVRSIWGFKDHGGIADAIGDFGPSTPAYFSA